MDHHVHAAITEGLRRRGVGAMTAEEDGAAQFDDERLLLRATPLGRVLFSQDSGSANARLHPPGYWWPANFVDAKWPHPMFGAIAPFLLDARVRDQVENDQCYRLHIQPRTPPRTGSEESSGNGGTCGFAMGANYSRQ